jgi:hypothetical protein
MTFVTFVWSPEFSNVTVAWKGFSCGCVIVILISVPNVIYRPYTAKAKERIAASPLQNPLCRLINGLDSGFARFWTAFGGFLRCVRLALVFLLFFAIGKKSVVMTQMSPWIL